MLRDFLINVSIFTSILFVFNRLLKSNNIFPNLSYKFKVGVGQGFLGIILMFFTIHVTSTVIVDLRHLAIVTAAFLGGFPAALLAGSIIGVARIFLLGGITKAAIIGCSNALISGLLTGIVAEKIKNIKIKWAIINLICIIIFAMLTSLLFSDKSVFYKVFLYYFIASIIGAALGGLLLNYLHQANKLELDLKESEERNRRLIELLPESLIVHAKGIIIYANRAAKQQFSGLSNVSILNKRVTDFVHEDSLDIVNQRIKALQTSDNMTVDQIEEKLMTIEKKVFHAEVSASSIWYKGQPAVLSIIRDISERKVTEQQLKELNEKLLLLASVDGLTGIANRRIFDETLQKEWQKCQTAQLPISIILFDIDHFKLYNDTYGHGEGDECLKKIAAATNQLMQAFDGLLARYGGEEFVIILPNTHAQKALLIAEDIRLHIESLQIPHSNSLVSSVVTSSIGVTTCIPSPIDTIDTILKQADDALYVAKNNGRNRVEAHQIQPTH